MHRPSAAENPSAPLGHHTFDSTHISFGVVTAAIDRGPWIVEGSIFNGREPDENRWDFDFAALDSFSGRLWFRPNGEWEFQASSGRLRQPEALDPGDLTRTTFSGVWFRRRDENFTAVAAGYGWNQQHEGAHASFFAEATRHAGLNSLYGRFEAHEPEIGILLRGQLPLTPDFAGLRGTVLKFTLGGVREIVRKRGFELGIGGDVNFYAVPTVLEPDYRLCETTLCLLAPGYGSRPASFHIFLRLRPPAPMGRMWNMRMSQPMMGH